MDIHLLNRISSSILHQSMVVRRVLPAEGTCSRPEAYLLLPERKACSAHEYVQTAWRMIFLGVSHTYKAARSHIGAKGLSDSQEAIANSLQCPRQFV